MATVSVLLPGETDHLPELRLVLLGSRKSGKSSSGNTILGREEFELKRTAQCVMKQREVAGRLITVVKAPGWWNNISVEDSTELLKQEIVLSVSLCPPGPHALLLMIRLDSTFKENESTVLTGHLNLLTDSVWSHTLVLFTCGDWLGDTPIEQHIESEGKALQSLVEKCGNRYHVLNNENRDDTQVTELLKKIKEIVAANEPQPTPFMHHHLPELRMVLLGSRKSGKSSSGNTILGREEFELKRTAQCVKRHREVAGRLITVVEAPGWLADTSVKDSTELLRQEIVLSVSQWPPGPHTFLLIIRLDTTFNQKKKRALVGHLNILTESVWSHTIVLFTCGDWLGDTPIEQHIESEGKALQWLIEKCGNRYHVLNNENRGDDTQVTELLWNIEEMVMANGGDHFEMVGMTLWKVEEKRRAEEERAKERVMKVEKQRECFRSLHKNTHNLPELRIVLLGSRNAGKSSSGNTILGREEFDLKRTAQCVKRDREVAGRHITVVEAPGWWSNMSVEDSTELLKQEIFFSALVCPPGPHALLLIIRLDTIFKRNKKRVLQGHLKRLSDSVWRHTIVLFTCGDWLGDTPIEQHIESEGKALQSLVEKCGNRYHVLNNENRNDTQVPELLEKIEEMVAANCGGYFEMDGKIVQEVEEKKKAVEERAKKRMMRITTRTRMRDKSHHSSLRIVLLGSRKSGKMVRNTILGDDFESKRTVHCVKRQGEVAGRHITVVEDPGWWSKNTVNFSTFLCTLEPYAVLLVICADASFMKKETQALNQYLVLLSERVWHHTIVLFTCGDCLGDTPIEQHIESEGKALQWLVEKCGNRYHVFNNENEGDATQVTELLEKIEEMVAANRTETTDIRKKYSSDLPMTGCLTIALAASSPIVWPLHLKECVMLCQQSPTEAEMFSPQVRIKSRGVEDKKYNSYRFLCPHAGQFQCRLTGLVFETEGKGELLYRIDSWDTRLLDGLGQMQPAGPLYDISCFKGSVSQLHLPHCEIQCDEHQVELAVAHFTGDNIEIIKPLEVTKSHVIIFIHKLSLFGLLKKMLYDSSISGQVLLFYKEIPSKQIRKKLHIHLLPGNVPVEEVKNRHVDFKHIETSSKCQLTPGRKYKPSCNPYLFQPKVETFECDYGPNYHPMFEVFLHFTTEDITVGLLDENGQEVWEPRLVIIAEDASLKLDLTMAQFVDQHRENLIQRVSSVIEIADSLKSKFLTSEMYNSITTARTTQDQMRFLYTALDSGGARAKAEFYQILHRNPAFRLIADDLEARPSKM